MATQKPRRRSYTRLQKEGIPQQTGLYPPSIVLAAANHFEDTESH